MRQWRYNRPKRLSQRDKGGERATAAGFEPAPTGPKVGRPRISPARPPPLPPAKAFGTVKRAEYDPPNVQFIFSFSH